LIAWQVVSHNIALQIYGNSVVNRLIAILNKTDADLFAQITAKLETLPPNSFTVQRLDLLLASVRALNAQTYAQVSGELNNELKSLVEYEAGYHLGLFQNTVPVQLSFASVNVEQVYAAALARPFQGKLLKEWYAQLETSKQTAIRDAIRLGYVESETTSQIVKRIRGTKALAYKDGVLDITKRNAESIVLTAVAHTSSYAQQSVYDANSDYLSCY